MSIDAIIKKLQEQEIKNYLLEYGICKILLFGSHSKGYANNDSDIDLLYQIDDNVPYKAWGIFAVKGFLEDKLGKKCDMVNENYIDSSIKKEILESKRAIW